MIWWVSVPSRAREERALIAELQESVAWLSELAWRIEEGGRLVADFTMIVGEQPVRLQLKYPEYFPDLPPSITPVETVLLSGHQYGAGGELCLEYRADNWLPDYTGKMLIESAYRLLSTEGDSSAQPVPSAHRTTIGQQVRGSFLRFLVWDEPGRALLSLEPGEQMQATIVELKNGGTWVATISRLGPEEAPIYEAKLPIDVGYRKMVGIAYRLREGEALPKTVSGANFFETLVELDLDEWFEEAEAQKNGFVMFITPDEIRGVMFFSATELAVYEHKTILAPDGQPRLPPAYGALGDRLIGVVGCGSLGSKIAVSLARSGVRRFVVVDPDIFFPDNVVRNELDLRSIGVNKSKALRQRIQEVNSEAEVDARSILLGGQESGESTALVVSKLSECDLIIDATADARVFNLCATVAKAELKPMIWGQVFGGGIGGLVAMARPGIDPPPQLARNQIMAWYKQQGVEWKFADGPRYGGEADDGEALIASDADVSVIAGHLTRFALDALVRPQDSAFPQAAYAVGMAPEWIFSAPFETFPISYVAEGQWGPGREDNAQEDAVLLLKELIHVATDEA